MSCCGNVEKLKFWVKIKILRYRLGGVANELRYEECLSKRALDICMASV